jgi:RHS repeat-associated protein
MLRKLAVINVGNYLCNFIFIAGMLCYRRNLCSQSPRRSGRHLRGTLFMDGGHPAEKGKMGDGLNADSAYDANGNILAMRQMGLKLNASSVIDKLTYTYNSNSNKLARVADSLTTDQKLGDFTDGNTGSDDYGYDVNGNLLKDRNKAIGGASTDGIIYNHLNLPYQVSVTGKGTIKYIYDATGNKLEKITKDTVIANKTNTTDYLNGFVYENNTLQFFGHEEGRVRMNHAVSLTSPTVFAYDYFIKDHLGNTRVVLTDEKQTDPYPAVTLETNSLAIDTLYYGITASNIKDVTLITGYSTATHNSYQNNNGIANPNYNIDPNGDSYKMYMLDGSSGNRNGLGITLKVMTGDTVNIFGRSFWNSATPTNTGHSIVVNDLLTLLANISPVSGSGKGATSGALIASGVTPAELGHWLADSVTTTSGRPRAYINWILFDEQFRIVSSSSGFNTVGGANDVYTHSIPTVNIIKNGYLYAYCSNESDVPVFFDNFQVIHKRGPLLETTEYYPFGLTMAGISSKAAGKLENRMKFNGGNELQSKEFSDGSGIDWYDANFRMYDAQIGRFNQQDPLAGASLNLSPYAFVQNNPILFNDPLGLDTVRTGTTNGGNTASATNKDGTTGTYVVDPNNSNELVGTGMSGSSEVTLAPKEKKSSGFGGFYFPEIRKGQGKWSDKMSARLRDNQPLIQKGDPDWLQDQIPFHKQNFEAEQDYRKMQIGAVIAIASPVLIMAVPEVLAASSTAYAELSAAYFERSLILHMQTNLALDWVKTRILGGILSGTVGVLGRNALYYRGVWGISSEMGDFRSPLNGQTIPKVVKGIEKGVEKIDKLIN